MLAALLALPLVAPSYFWLEAERMDGVSGHYSSFQEETPAPGWHFNGPGVSAEWGQGGESGANSISCGSRADKAAVARTRIVLPHAGAWKIWVRYSENRDGATPVSVRALQAGRSAVTARLGTEPSLDPQDEALAYWGWTFVWGVAEGMLSAGPTELELGCDRAAKARRIVDVVALTDDPKWRPSGRLRPPFAYLEALAKWRIDAASRRPAADRVPPVAWRASTPFEVPWNFDARSFAPGMPPFAVEPSLRAAFIAAFRGKPIPLFSSPLLVPVFPLNGLAEILPGHPTRRYLDATGKPFYVLVNYQSADWRKDEKLRAQIAGARRALAKFDRGDLSGESLGHPWDLDSKALAATLERSSDRSAALTTIETTYAAALRRKREALYRDDANPWRSLIPALSANLPTYAHAALAWGAPMIGLETAVGMPAFASYLAFARGAARQFGRQFLYYHAPNFGDTATTFTTQQNFSGPGTWFHTRYGLVFGPSIAWYRKALLLQWLGGARAIYLEQGFDQFFQPGPGAHPVQLNPLGRVTQAFLELAEKHPDRGEPIRGAALLLDPAHGWDTGASYVPRAFAQDVANRALARGDADRAIEETLDVLFYPNAQVQGEPATAERQTFVHAMLGDATDVLVARDDTPIEDYAVVIVAGRVRVPEPLVGRIERHLSRGGRLLLARGSAPALEPLCGHPGVHCVAAPLGLSPDGSADPEWALAIADAVWSASPVHVQGDIEWLVSRNRSGYVVGLLNSRGNYKPQQGLQIAPHRDEIAEVTIETALPVRAAREWMTRETLPYEKTGVRLRVPAGAVRIVELRVR